VKVGEGFAVCSSSTAASVSIFNASHGDVRITVTGSDGGVAHAWVTADQARALARALSDAVKGEP